ncbi:MAG: GNAT family N-acetyltransferase [Acidobacteriota bacterium]|nr:MAG: GNAT family N-acetyltransferase [Acidobacteriota bacterium]
MKQKIILETQRLILRELEPADADAIAEIICDADTMKYFPAPYSRSDVDQWLERNFERYRTDGHGLWAVMLKSDGSVIGDCGLTWQDVDGVRELEVGYHFNKRYWGHGYATEAAKACMEYAFNRLGHNRIISLIRPENVASARVAERNGLEVEKQTIRAGLAHDVYSAIMLSSLLAQLTVT